MGKHLWTKHEDEELLQRKPGCVWGFLRVLDYHRWRYKAMRINHRDTLESLKRDSCSAAAKLYGLDGYKADMFFDGDDTKSLHDKKYKATKNQSFGVRVQALIGEGIPMERRNVIGKEGFDFKTKLQGAYPIQSLESLNVDWKHSLVLLPENVENYAVELADTAEYNTAGKEEEDERIFNVCSPMDAEKSECKETSDILDIFKLDKGLLIKQLKNDDQTIANFSRTALGLNKKSKLRRSKSFPSVQMSKDQKLKPSKLERKWKEIWSVRRGNKFQTVSTFPWSAHRRADGANECNDTSWEVREMTRQTDNKMVMSVSGFKWLSDVNPYSDRFEEAVDRIQKNAIGDQEPVEDGDKSSSLYHSSSLTEAFDNHPQLFENCFGLDVKLTPKCLKLSNAHADIRRTRSLSNVDTRHSNSNFEAGNSIDGCDRRHGQDSYSNSRSSSHKSDAEGEDNDGLSKEAAKLENKDSIIEQGTNSTSTSNKEISCQEFCFSTDMQEADLSTSKGLARAPGFDELDFSFHLNDPKSLQSKYPSTHRLLNIEQNETLDNVCIACLEETDSDLCYVRYLLDQSGIDLGPSEALWHGTDQPLSPKLFEKVEACWPHKKEQLNRWPDFYGCWHHQLMFDLVNEVILEVYDVSFPYYPKALSSSCHVRPFPLGNSIVEEVSGCIGALINLKSQFMVQSIDSIVACDLGHDRSWMNLQLEIENIGIKLEYMIFDEVLEEILFSRAC